MKLSRLLFPICLVAILGFMTWLMVSNYQRVEDLRKEGKNPVTIATPGVNGRDGQPGARGETGAQGLPGADGKDGAAGVAGQNGVAGQLGPTGQPGRNGTDGASIKGDPGEQGVQGAPGIAGAVGAPGNPGKNPLIGCVTRTLNGLSVNYIAWRYEDESDVAYRNLYRLPTWAQAESCVDLRNL